MDKMQKYCGVCNARRQAPCEPCDAGSDWRFDPSAVPASLRAKSIEERLNDIEDLLPKLNNGLKLLAAAVDRLGGQTATNIDIFPKTPELDNLPED